MNAENHCCVIGLTGSSGSGKSEAAKMLANLGALIIDADEAAHAIVEKREVLDELASAFGDWVVDGAGRYNRAQVSIRAFSDKGFLERLTAITHKYIIEEILSRVDELKRGAGGTQKTIIVIDAPIPVEHGFLDISDYVLVIKAPRAQRLNRIIERDGISGAAAEARLLSQMPDEEYIKLADAVICNEGDMEALEHEMTKLYGCLINNLKNCSSDNKKTGSMCDFRGDSRGDEK